MMGCEIRIVLLLLYTHAHLHLESFLNITSDATRPTIQFDRQIHVQDY